MSSPTLQPTFCPNCRTRSSRARNAATGQKIEHLFAVEHREFGQAVGLAERRLAVADGWKLVVLGVVVLAVGGSYPKISDN